MKNIRDYLSAVILIILASGFMSTIHAKDAMKEFPEYKCRLTLPNETWSWDDNEKKPNLIAIARSEDGLILIFGVYPQKDGYAICDKFISGFENGQLDNPGVSKTAGQKLTYCGVPCYQLDTYLSEEKMHSMNRVFNAHGYSYLLALMYPEGYKDTKLILEQKFECFTFTSKPSVKLRPENTAYEQGRRIGQITYRVMIWTIIIYAIYAIARRLFRKNHKKTREVDIIRKKGD
jgi:hypothetical protein